MCVNLNECIYGKIPLPPLPPLLEYAPSGLGKNTLPRQTAIFRKTSAPPIPRGGEDTMKPTSGLGSELGLAFGPAIDLHKRS